MCTNQSVVFYVYLVKFCFSLNVCFIFRHVYIGVGVDVCGRQRHQISVDLE